jgi:alpha-mannosidase
MGILSPEWDGRIRHWIRTLEADFYEPLGEIEFQAFKTKDHLKYEELDREKFVPVSAGLSWGEAWEYCWFLGDILLPKKAEGERIVLDLKPSWESTLFVNGKEFGTYRAEWVAKAHHYLVDNTIAVNAKSGSSYHIAMETYAGHDYPGSGSNATGPVLPESNPFKKVKKNGDRRQLGTSTFGIWREEVYQLYMDVMTLWNLLQDLDQESLRAAKIAATLKQFTKEVEFEQDAEGRLSDYKKAREALKGALLAKNGSTMPQFWAVGNAHIDLAWLWPVAETRRKTARTFAAQLRLLEEYPDYCYIQSQPAAYEICRRDYPELFEKIRVAIREGRWIADGAMWVEPDTNITGGESLIRQILHGKRYFKEMFSVDSHVLWLPDSFGYSAALPQILMGCDVPYMVTQKIFWSYNGGERFPYHYFYWEGLDGTKITSFLPTSYTYQTDPGEICRTFKNRAQKEDLDAFLFPFGYGDGGGGPARDHIEYVLREKDLEGCPRVKMGSPEEFFHWMEEEGGPDHTYVGELYFSAHRGTYTSQAAIKKYNRRNEILLHEMEFFGSLLSMAGGSYDLARADKLWKTLLFHQFHDILPGSSIERVYKEAEVCQQALQEEALQIARNEAESLLKDKEGISIFNSLSFARKAVVLLPEEYQSGARTIEGVSVPVQKLKKGVVALVSLPSCGAVSLLPSDHCDKKEENLLPATIVKEGEGYRIENGKIAVWIDGAGQVISFVMKASGREISAGEMNQLRLYRDQPRAYDAWDIDSNYREEAPEFAKVEGISILDQGLLAVLEIKGKIGKSEYTQRICLGAEGERLEFDTKIEWREMHRLLKVSFPVDVHTENARHEIQFGYVKRPTHRSRQYDKDRFEVCNHRYTALCDESHGAALLNNGKYGISANKNDMELTLLRASTSPARADNGMQHFAYALYAWEGSFIESDVVRQGYEFNVEPFVIEGSIPAFEAVSILPKNIILEAMKPAEDGSGDVIFRLYEAAGAAVNAEIKIELPVGKIWECNMLEEEKTLLSEGKENLPVLHLAFRAFEIKTLRLQKVN